MNCLIAVFLWPFCTTTWESGGVKGFREDLGNGGSKAESKLCGLNMEDDGGAEKERLVHQRARCLQNAACDHAML